MSGLRSIMLFATFALPFAAAPAAFAIPSVCDATALNLLVNCGFENGNFSGWTSTATTYTGVDRSNPSSGSYAASLGSPTAVYLYQTVTDVAGAYYSLSFKLDNEIAKDANGTPYTGGNSFEAGYRNKSGTIIPLVQLTNLNETGLYQTYTYFFFGTGSDTVGFLYDNVPSYFALDDVIFKDPPAPGSELPPADSGAVSAATPEPSSLMLMGTGVMALAGVIRRRLVSASGEPAA